MLALTRIPCRFGCPEAILYIEMDGCICYPTDTHQALCAQHAHNSEPLGDWKVVAEAFPGAARWVLG